MRMAREMSGWLDRWMGEWMDQDERHFQPHRELGIRPQTAQAMCSTYQNHGKTFPPF